MPPPKNPLVVDEIQKLAAQVAHLRAPTSWIIAAQPQLRAAQLLNQHLQARFAGAGIVPRPGGGGIVDALYIVDMDLFKTIYLLAGLALEMIFKGAIVAREPSAIDDQARADWQRQRGLGHNLVELGQRAELEGLNFELLTQIETFISWKRYPAERDTFYESMQLTNLSGSHVADVLAEIERMYDLARERIGGS